MSNYIAISVITTLVTILVIGAVIVLVRRTDHGNHRWRCKEGKCEIDINGQYGSKTACQEACNSSLNAWACTSDHQCVKSEQGYTSKQLCEQNCAPPNATVGYPDYYPAYPYYPQSLLWYPRYRGWRRRW
jgi:uncharacterized protein YegP (UPF0339 family)